MALPTRVFFGLVAGLIAGAVIAVLDVPRLTGLVDVIEPIGALWVNAIRMTVIPLVMSLLIAGIASGPGLVATRTIGGGAVALFLLLAGATGLLALLAAPPLLDLIRLDDAVTAALHLEGAGAASAVELPPFRNWVVDIVPTNPVRAAADGAMLPLVVFSVIFGLALARAGETRDALVRPLHVVADAMFVIVGWVLAVAPVGVFALVLPLATRAGPALAGTLGQGLIIMCGLVVIALIGVYPVAALAGGVPLRRFARACAPAQAVAFGTRSSLASLPALLDGAHNVLRLPAAVTGLVLPGAVAIFKYASPAARLTGTLFVARLYGIELGTAELTAIAGAITLLSFYSPGIPSGGLFVMAPIYMTFGLPIEGIGLLIALDVVVDSFITTGNVTANMAVAVIIARRVSARHVGPAAATEGGVPAGV
jgi:proton glutamate symport protein